MGVMKIKKPKYILLDIERTTTSKDFFRSELMSFLMKGIPKYLTENYNKPAVQDVIGRLRTENVRNVPPGSSSITAVIPTDETGNRMQDVVDAVSKVVNAQVEEGIKSKTVMSLVFLVWCHGYSSGDIKGHVFNDIPASFRNWSRVGVKILTLSSMLIEGQELMFTRSKFGNLDQFIGGYMCTEDYGKKSTKECYDKIVRRVRGSASDFLFISHNKKDVETAKKSGMIAIRIDREHNSSPSSSSSSDNVSISSLRDIVFG